MLFKQIFLSLLLSLTFVSCTKKKETVTESAAASSGRFLLSMKDSQNYQHVKQVLEENGSFRIMSDGLNDVMNLPENIYIQFEECGENNAFYSKNEKKITFCYDFFNYILENFDSDVPGEYIGMDIVLHVFIHELGHALIDVLKLNITGREEDVVDQFSATFFLDTDGGGVQGAMNAAKYFASSSSNTPAWDEHALSEQRYYNLLCWAYGSSPQQNQFILGLGLPQERAVRCQEEYRKLDLAWAELLGPHIKAAYRTTDCNERKQFNAALPSYCQ